MDTHAESEFLPPHFLKFPVDVVSNVRKTEAVMNERFTDEPFATLSLPEARARGPPRRTPP
jgi:hypothetical protein